MNTTIVSRERRSVVVRFPSPGADHDDDTAIDRATMRIRGGLRPAAFDTTEETLP